MKILMVSTNRFDRNGMSVLVINYLVELRKLGIQVDLLASGAMDGKYAKIVKKDGRLFFFPERSKNPLKYIQFVKQVLNNNNYDILYIHGNSGTVAAEVLASKKLVKQKKLILCIHAHAQTTSHPIIHQLFRRFIVKWSNQNFAASDAAGKFMFGEAAFQVIPNGIYPSEYAFSPEARNRIRKSMNLPKDTTLIVQLGAFTPVKNYQFTLQLAKKCLQLNDHVHFSLFGDGPLKDQMKNKAVELGLANMISFEGVTTRVPEVLAAADLVIFPSLHEAFGIVALEAQAAGVPIAVTNNFTPSLRITNLISYLPLRVDNWHDWILRTSSIGMHKLGAYQDEISTAGYDIEKNAVSLKKILSSIKPGKIK